MTKHIASIFTIILSAAVLTCAVCNLAVSGEITWAWYPLVSCLFVWGVGLTGLVSKKHRISSSLTALTVFIFPYLYALAYLTSEPAVVEIGYPMAVLGCGYLWAVYGVRRFCKLGRWHTAGTACLLFIPFLVPANALIAYKFGQPVWGIWDTLAAAVLLVTAWLCFRRKDS